MDPLIPLMPLLGSLPIAVAAVIIAKIWRQRKDAPLAELQAQNQELRQELDGLRQELGEAQERLDFAERVLTRERRPDRLAEPGERD
jgi:uncharacterized membrane protein